MVERREVPTEMNLPTSNNAEGSSADQDAARREGPEDDGCVFSMHMASLYDTYANIKHGIMSEIKKRVMRFMRHDLDQTRSGNQTNAQNDVEGGAVSRSVNVTYDSLIFKVTILLGFLLQFPPMWVAGGMLFISSNNFKSSTIKWGCINIILAAVSIMYFLNEWQVRTEILSNNQPENGTLFDSIMPSEEWESDIIDNENSTIMRTFLNSSGLRWVGNIADPEIQNEGIILSRKSMLIDPDMVPDAMPYYIALGTEVVVTGWIQFGAMFTSRTITERDVAPTIFSGIDKIPVVYYPHDTMIFDVGMQCKTDSNLTVFIGVNASLENDHQIQSNAFYMQGMNTCRLAYSSTGGKPLVHKAFVTCL
ncbi:hypothetical protein BgAZ_403990 [Babesia gibsoni]|uniref:Uncharacterized protein n=1 Tax=Babesia gibsoni TaxID=33632 RepID=A0AAD8PD54_BABGI|nr:hypothetical protein BgAZ_403990 [Babesia gibsoni]